MTRLCRIKDTVQSVADAISVALGIETEVVDNELNIVAGTGRYKDKIGEGRRKMAVSMPVTFMAGSNHRERMHNRGCHYRPFYDPSVMRGETEELAEVCAP